MTFLLLIAGVLLVVLFSIIGIATYTWFDEDGRKPIVQKYSDMVRIEKRPERHSDTYYIQGRVLGVWIDYKQEFTDSAAKKSVQELLDIRKRMKNKSEVVEEYKI